MNKICRICLEEGVLSSVFTRNYNLSLCDMIEHCCNAKISKNDGLPEQICSNCVYKLGIAYHFKQTCESADIRLRQYLGLMVPKKLNDVAIMTDPVAVPIQTIIKKCKCQLAQSKKSMLNYKRKSETEKQKPGPKPKQKQVHQCYQCSKEFRCQAQLEIHVRTHTGDKPFGCSHCAQRFTQKHNLTVHMRVHTGEKPYQCEMCSKRFSAQSNLQTHLKIHTGQRDHPCTLCNKSFITSSELTRHMRKHRGVKDYKCAVCGVEFAQARNLKLHKLKKHLIDTSSKTEKKDVIDIINIDVKDASLSEEKTNLSLTTKLDSNQDKEGIDIDKNKMAWPSQKQLYKPFDVNPAAPREPTYAFRSLKESVETTPLVVEQKGLKDIFYNGLEKHSCRICGEQFDFLTALAQHYLLRHKDYDATHLRGYNIS